MQWVNATGEWGDASSPPSSAPSHPGNWFFRRPQWLECRTEVSDLEKRVYSLLFTRADGQNVARVAIETIAEDLGKGYSTIGTAIAKLKKRGLISVTLRREYKGASDYRLIAHEYQPDFVAKSHAKRREAARSSRPSEWYSRAPQWLECRTEVSDSAKLVYARLANHADRLNDTGELVATVRLATLAKETGKDHSITQRARVKGARKDCPRTIQRALRELVKHGLIERRLRRESNGASDYAIIEGHRWQAEFVERVASRAAGNRSANGFEGSEPHDKTEVSNGQNRGEPHDKTEVAEESLSRRTFKTPASEEPRTDAREPEPVIDGPRIHIRAPGIPRGAQFAVMAGEPDAAKRASAKRTAYQAEIERNASGIVEFMRDAERARAAGNDRDAANIDRVITLGYEAMERDPKRGIRYRADVKRRVFEILVERAGMPPRELPPAEPANVEPESVHRKPIDGSA